MNFLEWEKITEDTFFYEGLYLCVLFLDKEPPEYHFINVSVDEDNATHCGVSWDGSGTEFCEYDDGWALSEYDYMMRLPDVLVGKEWFKNLKCNMKGAKD